MSFRKNEASAIALIILIAASLLASGCAATATAIQYKDLDVETKMSASIFLDPVAPALRTVFVQVRNTSDKPDLNLEPDVAAAVQAKGYRVVTDPGQAHYLLQVNVLAAGHTDKTAIQNALGLGFGGIAAGATAGALLAGPGRYGRGALIGGVAGGMAEVIADNLVKAVTYGVVTDVQISERTSPGTVDERFDSQLKQGTASTYVTQTTTGATNLKKYQTRVISTATQVNLAWEVASPPLRQGLVNSISGLL